MKSTERRAQPDAAPRQPQPFKRIERRLAGTRSLTTTRAISARMGKVRQRGTFPELAARRIVHALGLRYTLSNRDLPGSPDIANRSRRFVIFVHGCFWHRHAGCIGASTPKSNRRFWRQKFAYNVRRDHGAAAALKKIGYRVVVIWECQAADRIAVTRKLASIRPQTRS